MFSFEHVEAVRAAEIRKVLAFLPSGSRILEIGAGTGAQAKALGTLGFSVVAVEVEDSQYKQNRVFPVIDYDGVKLPFPEASFDVVFSSNVLEHVGEIDTMNSEIARVLRPGGFALHVLPTTAWRFWTVLSTFADVPNHAIAELASDRRQLPSRILGGFRSGAHALAEAFRQPPHGARGGVWSEHWYFSDLWWRRTFRRAGFRVIHHQRMGLFYTGNMVLGLSWGISSRGRASALLGSSTMLYKVQPEIGGS